jgi:gamma-glutamyltranspeptidase/glutathione hydrolase
MLQRVTLAILALLLAAPAVAAGGVVSAADPRAAAAGREMLRAGGSATDAAIAMMLALNVVEPQSSGIGGGGFLVHAGADGATSIDGRETAPASARPDRFLTPDGQKMAFMDAVPGGISVGIPGNIRLAQMAHKRWGRLPWKRLFAPAIKLAADGFAISPALEERLQLTAKVMAGFPAARAIYLDKGGQPLPAGTVVRNPALATAFRAIAAGGPDAFYKGPIAAGISAAVASAPRHPARLDADDLAGYKAKPRPALCGRYRGYRICGMGPPSSGGVAILQMLGMLERFDLAGMGPEDPRSWHLIAEAMRLAYADRNTYLADPDYVPVPLKGLLDPNYVANRSALIRVDATIPHAGPGTPPGAEGWSYAKSGEVPSTTNFAAVDGRGEAVSWTSTIESAFGSFLIANGFFLNNELTDFSFLPETRGKPVANRLAAGKRPLSAMSPTLVYGRDGRLLLALGSAGGPRIIMHVLKTLIGVIDWKKPVGEAIALPNIFLSGDAILLEQGSPLEAMAPALTRLGQTVNAAVLPSKVNAVERGPHGWQGAADPRSEGVALAE